MKPPNPAALAFLAEEEAIARLTPFADMLNIAVTARSMPASPASVWAVTCYATPRHPTDTYGFRAMVQVMARLAPPPGMAPESWLTYRGMVPISIDMALTGPARDECPARVQYAHRTSFAILESSLDGTETASYNYELHLTPKRGQ